MVISKNDLTFLNTSGIFEYEIISIKRVLAMQIHINEQTCTGCNLCVFGCPEQAISCYAVANLDSSRCNGCLKCVHFCPVNAIEVKEKDR